MNSHHHGRPPPPGVVRGVESSNSTANKFLGTTRRPWMLGEVPPRRQPAPGANANSTPSSLAPRTPAPTASSPREESQAGIQQSISPALASSIVQSAQSMTTAVSYAGPAPVSPITPGSQLPESGPVSCNSLPLQQTSAAPETTPGLAQTTVLPSPEPSNGSHTSPACAADGDQEHNHPVDIGLSPRPQPSQLPEEAGAGAVIPTSSITPASSARPPERAIDQPSLQTSQANAHHVASSPAVRATGHTAQSSVSANLGSSQPSPSTQDPSSFWQIARIRLQLFHKESTQRGSLSETVDLPRLRLLQDACRSEDMFYLALHQVYCVSSYAPTQLTGLAQFAIEKGFWLEVIKQLLIDNQQLSGNFLHWCVYYPSPLRSMLENNDYRNALQQVGQTLALLSQHWVPFAKRLQSRSYPPLVEELVMQFGVTSPVMQKIIFTSLTRHVFGSGNEQLMDACLTLFDQNQGSYRQRPTSAPVEDVRREMEAFVRAYRALSRQYAVAAHRPAPMMVSEAERASQMQSPPIHVNTIPVNVPPVNMPPGTAVTHPQMRPGLAANSGVVRSSNPLSNTYTSTSIPPPSAVVSSNMMSNNQPQAQRQPLPQQHGFMQQRSAPYPVQASNQPPVHAPVTSGAPLQATGIHFDPRFPSQPHMYPVGPPVQHSMAPPVSTGPHVANYPSTNNINGQGQGVLYAPTQYPQAYPAPGLGRGAPQNVIANQQRMYGSPHGVPSQMPPATSTMRFPSQQAVSRARPPQSQQQVQSVPLLPSPGVIPSTLHRNPTVTALHQLHLRTPPTRLVRPDGGEAKDLVQYLSAFVIKPTPLEFERSSFRWQFSVPPDAYKRRARWISEREGGPARILSSGARTYRFRCIQFQDSSKVENIHFWAGTECRWPTAVYIHVNGEEVFVRRSFHHGKDLPVDITRYVKEGTNEISLNMLRSEHEKSKGTKYAIAVEIIEVNSSSSIRTAVCRLPAAESREQIRNRLSMHTGDEDLVFMDDYITIDLRDPFTARIFDTPVRGRSCLHRECFDLDTFLQTVVIAPATAGKKSPYLKCPICRKFAAPSLLIVDEFLLEIRTELERTQRLERTRSIRVKTDGSWEPVLEEETPQPSRSGSVVPAKRNRSEFEADRSETAKAEKDHDNAPSQVPSAPEVIELD